MNGLSKLRQNERRFSLAEIRKALNVAGIVCKETGLIVEEAHYAFKSLRFPESGGVYYLAEGGRLPPEVTGSVVICSVNVEVVDTNVWLAVDNPQLAFYTLMSFFLAPAPELGVVHPTAVIDADASVAPDVWIGPYCVIGKCVIESGVRLHSHVVIMDGSVVERDVEIESHSTIGATGVAWIWNPQTRERIRQPQVGYAVIGAGTFLGTDVTVVRGSVNEATTVGRNCVIAHGTKIGHGAVIGEESHFANNVSIAGNVTLGKRCFLGAAVVVRPQVKLAEGTIVGAGAVVVSSHDEKNIVLAGVPAKKIENESGRLAGVPKRLDVDDKRGR
jgi:UDP-3-O-[3-hydroxymyristoyl] glucosamine N-acyltransferase